MQIHFELTCICLNNLKFVECGIYFIHNIHSSAALTKARGTAVPLFPPTLPPLAEIEVGVCVCVQCQVPWRKCLRKTDLPQAQTRSKNTSIG
jgi:hypothetical protein